MRSSIIVGRPVRISTAVRTKKVDRVGRVVGTGGPRRPFTCSAIRTNQRRPRQRIGIARALAAKPRLIIAMKRYLARCVGAGTGAESAKAAARTQAQHGLHIP